VPIQIGQSEQALYVPRELTVLTNLTQPKNFMANLDENLASDSRIHKSQTKKEKKYLIENPSSQDEGEGESFSFAVESVPFETLDASFRVVDERSDEKGQKIYPVAGVELRLVGAGFKGRTNSVGIVSGIQVPLNSSFLVSVKDPYSRYRSTVVEVSASKIASGAPVTIRLMQEPTFEAYSRISGSEGNRDSGSICASVQGIDGKPIEGVTLTMWGMQENRPY
jgi:hypothetical protein